MLIRLTSSASGEIIMFAEHARQLFNAIGKECTARGVFTTEQLPQAIAALHQAVEEEKMAAPEGERDVRSGGGAESPGGEDEDHKAGRAGISLAQRAHPVIKMMEWTLKEEGFIVWEAEKDFSK